MDLVSGMRLEEESCHVAEKYGQENVLPAANYLQQKDVEGKLLPFIYYLLNNKNKKNPENI